MLLCNEEIMEFVLTILYEFYDMIKKCFNKCESLIDYILKKSIKSSGKNSSHFEKILHLKLKLPKAVYDNEQFTRLICTVDCDNLTYTTEFRCILLKKLILPKEVFFYQKFTRLICKVQVTPMSSAFIKMKCNNKKLPQTEELNLSNENDNNITKRKRGRPPKMMKKGYDLNLENDNNITQRKRGRPPKTMNKVYNYNLNSNNNNNINISNNSLKSIQYTSNDFGLSSSQGSSGSDSIKIEDVEKILHDLKET